MKRAVLVLAVAWTLQPACAARDADVDRVQILTVEARPLRTLDNGVVLRNGGFGSAIVVDPSQPGHFYLLTDRGPNVDTLEENVKLFPLPAFTPQIGRFRRRGDALQRVATIELKNEAGRPLTGLPFPSRPAGVGERAVATDGSPLAGDSAGIDPEGLAVLRDGTFWISDEYGPTLLHIDATGRTIERVTPFEANARGRRLPRVLALRRPNNGMEGLTVTPDGRTLVGLMQGPLDNPDSRRGAARLARLVTFDLASGATRQFVYVQEDLRLYNSAIAAITTDTFLVLERDEAFAGDAARPARIKRIYRIDLTGATDVSDPADGPNGRLFNGRTLEQLQPSDLADAGVVAVKKTLTLDLLALEPGYPHDKAEGLAILDDHHIAIANDDDFGVTGDGAGGVARKIVPGLSNEVDRNRVYLIRLDKPIRPSS